MARCGKTNEFPLSTAHLKSSGRGRDLRHNPDADVGRTRGPLWSYQCVTIYAASHGFEIDYLENDVR
jgi:hypothetical protein